MSTPSDCASSVRWPPRVSLLVLSVGAESLSAGTPQTGAPLLSRPWRHSDMVLPAGSEAGLWNAWTDTRPMVPAADAPIRAIRHGPVTRFSHGVWSSEHHSQVNRLDDYRLNNRRR